MMRGIWSLAIVSGLWGGLALADSIARNALVAQQHLRQLHAATMIYWNEASHPPLDPATLFPRYVRNPRTFWHPADRDPAPRTINNSVPNAPNSARISFEWDLDPLAAGDEPWIWDNTPTNNGGRLVNFITYDGVIETDPPMATSTVTATWTWTICTRS